MRSTGRSRTNAIASWRTSEASLIDRVVQHRPELGTLLVHAAQHPQSRPGCCKARSLRARLCALETTVAAMASRSSSSASPWLRASWRELVCCRVQRRPIERRCSFARALVAVPDSPTRSFGAVRARPSSRDAYFVTRSRTPELSSMPIAASPSAPTPRRGAIEAFTRTGMSDTFDFRSRRAPAIVPLQRRQAIPRRYAKFSCDDLSLLELGDRRDPELAPTT